MKFGRRELWSHKSARYVAGLLPKIVVYYCVQRVLVHSTNGLYDRQEVPALTVIEALKRWRPYPNDEQYVRIFFK